MRNLPLRRMDPCNFERLAPDLEPFQAKRATILLRPGEPAGHAVFLSSGIGSLIAKSPEGLRVEAGLFGRDGFAPTNFALDDDQSPFNGTFQVPGDGYRIAAGWLRAALEASATLRSILGRYALALAAQAAFTALSNAVHPVEERLARWLLMCDDRSDAGEFSVTHELMSIMLAVRRPSVTTALHVLEGNGFIRSERGLVVIRDRGALEASAGDAYGKPEREYERLLGPLR